MIPQGIEVGFNILPRQLIPKDEDLEPHQIWLEKLKLLDLRWQESATLYILKILQKIVAKK